MRKEAVDHLGNKYSTIKSMCDAYNVSYDVYYARVRLGMSVDQALTGNFIEFHNEFEKAEQRRIKQVRKNNGTELVFPMEIALSEIKPESYYERKSGIYLIENKKNGKRYVGQARHLYERLYEHKSEPFYKNKNYNNLINVAIREDGIESFVCRILSCHMPNTKGIEEILNREEQKYIEEYKSFFPDGYNMTLGGQGIPVKKFSDDEINQMIKDYTEFVPVKEIIQKNGICQETLRNILLSNNIPKRIKDTTARDKRICELYQELKSIRKVAKIVGLGYDQVKATLHKNNVEMQRRIPSNEVSADLRPYYPQLDQVRDELFEQYRSGVGIRRLEDIYYKRLSIIPKTRTNVENLIKSYLIEVGGFDITKSRKPVINKVYMLRSSKDNAPILMEFINASEAARYLSKRLGKTEEQCRSVIKAVLSPNTSSVSAYGFGFSRNPAPIQALNYVLGTKKSSFSKAYGTNRYKQLIEEYENLEKKGNPVEYFRNRIEEIMQAG